MNSKSVELNAANEKLSKLIDNLEIAHLEYDKALEHSASYLGNDEKIEKARDDRAACAFNDMNVIKEEIANQTNLIEALVKAY
ncbi:hypothetical protein OGX92_06730 [Citrobacter sp. Cpo089]|uniref:hypothetical protein n=1 Tax=Citrobacter sp. Cpo089 TaxID=2985138 RepID=UPI002578AA4A|nr:hypothetical protein [Citrobacter sp. Cpo089]MDM2825122.1 hypothetical protein [Citrobacter sp. Cpo089]